MAMWLKQSTAVEIKMGPFLDSTDGNTQETGLTISQADVRLAKNGGDWAQKNESTTMVHEEAGWYRCLLDATDTNTLGILIVATHESGALPVWREFLVVPADVYDAEISGSGAGVRSNVVAISDDTTAADNLESEYDGTGYGQVLQRTTIATLSSQTAFTLTAGSADNDAYNGCIAVIEDASTAAQKAVGVVLDYVGASKTITLLTDPAVFTMAATDKITLIADRALKATVDNRTLDVSAGGEAGVDWANIGSPTTTQNLSGTTVKTATDIATAVAALPTAAQNADAVLDESVLDHNTGSKLGAYVELTHSNAVLANQNTTPTRSNTAQAGGASTITLDASASATDDLYNGQVVFLTGGTGAGQTALITDYNGTTKVATVDPAWEVEPDNTTTFRIMQTRLDAVGGGSAPTAEEVAAAVWDEDATAHTGGNKAGAFLVSTYLNTTPTRDGTAQDGDTAEITLDAGASAQNDVYNGQLVYLVSGTGAGQTAIIDDYDGGSKVANVFPAWAVVPDNTSVFSIRQTRMDKLQEITDGVDAAAITLNLINNLVNDILEGVGTDVVSSSVNTGSSTPTSIVDNAAQLNNTIADYYVGCKVRIFNGDNAGLERHVTAYDHTTRTLTVAPAFPAAFSGFTLFRVVAQGLPEASGGAPTAAQVADAVWDEATAGHVAAGSFGELAAEVPTANENADALLKRDLDAVEATAPLHSLLTALLKLVGRTKLEATLLRIYRTNGTTTHATQARTVDAALQPTSELGGAT